MFLKFRILFRLLWTSLPTMKLLSQEPSTHVWSKERLIYLPEEKSTLCSLLSQILLSVNLEEESCGQMREPPPHTLYIREPGVLLSWLRLVVGFFFGSFSQVTG
jgi:hypothetical protein